MGRVAQLGVFKWVTVAVSLRNPFPCIKCKEESVKCGVSNNTALESIGSMDSNYSHSVLHQRYIDRRPFLWSFSQAVVRYVMALPGSLSISPCLRSFCGHELCQCVHCLIPCRWWM